MRTMRSRGIAGGLLTLGCWAILSSPGACQNAQQPYTFHTETREIVLDIVVTDRHGHFVNGLTKGDFTVFEDKTKQQIRSFQAPEEHRISADVPPVQSSADLGRIGNAPVTILVLDELNTQFADMAFARKAAEEWIEKQPERLREPTVLMAAGDDRFVVVHDYTQDREALLASLRKHFPSYPYKMAKGGSGGPDAGTRMAQSLGTLVQIAQASNGTPGRKNVIWIGSGFPALLLDNVNADKEEEILEAAQKATQLLLQARVTLNIIDPTAMADSSVDLNNPDYLTPDFLQSMMSPTTATQAGVLNFDTFAPATGGTLFAGKNDVEAGIAQAVDNGTNYYTLTYSPTNHNDVPKVMRRINVVMRDPNLTATTRTGYFVSPEPKPGEQPPPPSTHQLAFDLINAGLSSMSYNGLNVHAEKSAKGYLIHVASADLTPRVQPNGRRTDEVTIMRVEFGRKSAVEAHQLYELTSDLSGSGDISATVTFIVPAASPSQRTTRIRFVVRDAISGKIGTAEVAP